MTNARGIYFNPEHDRPQDWDFLRAWQPNVIRLMLPGSHSDPRSLDVNRIKRVHDTCPAATILVRCWDVDDRNFEAHDAMVQDPQREAAKQIDWWTTVQARAEAAGVPRDKFMAGLNNETGPEKDPALYSYTKTALELATQRGLRLGVFCFSVGRPALAGEGDYNIGRFAQLDPLIVANRGAIVLHEYMQPEGMYAVWTDAEGNERKDYTYLIGRNTRWLVQSPIIIGEWGIDGILYNRHPDPTYGNAGWRNFKADWPPSRYADEYVECIRKANPNVIGICPFISDWSDHKWQSFDMIDAYPELLARKDLCVTATTPPHTTHIPQVGTGEPPQEQPPVPSLAHPIYKPEQRIISQRFGENLQDYVKFGLAGHNGVDFAVPNGTHVLAVDEGVVLEVGMDHDGYGLYVKLHHQWGESIYAHLLERFPKRGDQVYKGQWIGNSGNTGNSTGPHLHFAMRVYPYTRGYPFDGYVDPLPYLEGQHKPTSRHEIIRAVCAAAKEFGVDPDLLLSQAWAESSFNPYAVSSAGAQGLFQVMPATWGEWGPKVGASDPFNVIDSARVGAAYMAWLLKQTDGFEFDALVAYGWGIGNLLNNAGGVSGAPDMWLGYAGKIIHGRDLLRAVGA